jgi:hypothetical protein
MIDILTPAIIVAIAGIIVQGIKALLDLLDQVKSRNTVTRQKNISLAVALMQLIDVTSHSMGEKLILKEKVVKYLLKDTLPEEIIKILNI